MRLLICLAACCLLSASSFAAEPLRILAWNIESGGSNVRVILQQLRELQKSETFDVLALSEVSRKDDGYFVTFFDHTGITHGEKGGDDQLLIVWNLERLQASQRTELLEFEGVELAPGGHRAPLIIRLHDRETSRDFLLMNNHLARAKNDLRTLQARTLVDWARQQSLPAILFGDYNLDYDFKRDRGNPALPAILADGIFKWIKPDPLTDSNWAGGPDGQDRYPDSLLDFVFASGPAKDWKITVKVIVREGDFPDDDKTSDHRPVLVTIE